MGKLHRIDIIKIKPIKTDNWSEDNVYYWSFVNFGKNGPDGNHPGSVVPYHAMQLTKSTLRNPLPFTKDRNGVYSGWGKLFETLSTYTEEPPTLVSGPIFFFDSESPGARSKPSKFLSWLGVAVISVATVILTVGMSFAGLPWAGAATGFATAVALGYGWHRLLRYLARDDYLGGIRISYPYESNQSEVKETHTLIGASNGIQSDSSSGRPPIKWDRSSAEYEVTFRVLYR